MRVDLFDWQSATETPEQAGICSTHHDQSNKQVSSRTLGSNLGLIHGLDSAPEVDATHVFVVDTTDDSWL